MTITHVPFQEICVRPETLLRDVVEVIDSGNLGLALVLDEYGRLKGTITDGDIRRAFLDRLPLRLTAGALLSHKKTHLPEYSKPSTLPIESTEADQVELMKHKVIRHLPLLDDDRRLAGLVTYEPSTDSGPGMQAVVFAGGRGTRLQPLTDDIPKPMLPVGGRPLMEHTVEQLRDAGIRKISITTHYKSDQIRDHFGDGSDFGVDIGYTAEDEPLGTAGALHMVEADGPLLVINGDVVTRLDYRAMLNFHQEHGALLTLGVRQYDFQVPYGVVRSSGVDVTAIEEKPQYQFLVNAGIYLLDPSVLSYIPANTRYEMPDLIQRLMDDGLRVVNFPIREYWIDVGQHEDYRQAQEDHA